MNFTLTNQYLSKQVLKHVEEEAKRRWKVLAVLLALSVRLAPDEERKTKTATISPVASPTPANSPVLSPERVSSSEASPAPANGLVASLAPARVLLLIMDPLLTYDLTRALQTAGFSVMAARSAESALRTVSRASLVILDEDLPGLEETCLRLHNQCKVPVVVLGSKSDGEAWNSAAAMQIDAHLRRSLSHREWVARIRAILRR